MGVAFKTGLLKSNYLGSGEATFVVVFHHQGKFISKQCIYILSFFYGVKNGQNSITSKNSDKMD